MGEINNRIFESLERQKKTMRALAEYIGAKEAAVGAWRKRGTEPKAIYIKKIAEFLNVSEDYLLTGEKKTVGGYEYNTEKIAQEISINPELKTLFEACKNASPKDIKLLTEMLRMMTEKNDRID